MTVPAAESRPRAPFRRMIEVQAAHSAGDALVAIALAGTLFFSVPLGQARDRVGLYLLITMTPFAVLSPVVGPLLDRRPGGYRIAILLSAAGRCALALFMATRTDRLLLYPLAFGMLVLSRTHGVSRGALVPEVVPGGRSLMWANARLGLASILGGAIVALPGVGIQRLLGSGATLRVAAAVFAVGAIISFSLPRPAAVGDSRAGRARAARALLAPKLLAGGLATAVSRAALGFIVFMLAFAMRARGESARSFALVLIAAAAGTLGGSLLAPILRAILRESLLILLSLFAMSAAAFAASGRFTISGAVVVAGATGIGTSAARLGFDSLVQTEAPEAMRARTFARFETIFQVCWVAGAGLATAIPFDPSAGLRVMALICVFGVVAAVTEAAHRARQDREAGGRV